MTGPVGRELPATVFIRLPEGVSNDPPEPGTHPADETYCTSDRDGTVRCPVKGPAGPQLRVRIDRAVPGAEGRIWTDAPAGDPFKENNSRPVHMLALGEDGKPLRTNPRDTALLVAGAGAAGAVVLGGAGYAVSLLRRMRARARVRARARARVRAGGRRARGRRRKR
jgi:hypothetical protein